MRELEFNQLWIAYQCSLSDHVNVFRCVGEAKAEGREGGGEAATPVAKPHKGAARWRDAVGLGFLRKSMVVSGG